ncbi:Lead uptake protein, partial [Pseudomonas coronafaciens pv. striafaciens]
MPLRSRFLAWLLVPLLTLCSLGVLADPVEGAAQALHLLDYLSADYPSAVADGKVVAETGYQRQTDALTTLQALILTLPKRAERAELEQGIAELTRAVSDRQDGARVARQARQLAAKLAAAYEVSQAPAITPDPARGAPLYA